jgi:phage terminase large subunit-like protein
MTTPRDVLSRLILEDGRRWIDAAEGFQLADALAVLEGDRPYNFLTRARGASKTTDLAAVALSDLLTLPAADRLYWIGADSDQGALAIDAIAGFASRSAWIGSRIEIQNRKIVVPATDASLEVLAADAAGAWGLRPRAIYADELAQWADTSAPRRLWEALSSAVAKRTDAGLVVLTTAGDPSHFSARILEHARGSDLWRVNEVPGPSPWADPARLAEQKARLTESAYGRLFENRWTAAEDRLTTIEAVRECVTHEGPLAFDRGRDYVIGLDIGLKRDRTVAALAHKEGSRIVLDRIGVWKGSRLRPVRIEEIEAWVAQASESYGNARIVADPWQSIGLLQRLKKAGHRADEFTFSQQSVGRLASTLYGLFRDRNLAIPDDPDLIDELAHVRLIEKSPGVFRMDHDPGRHDDRAVALALAATSLLQKDEPGAPTVGPSIWDAGDGVPIGQWRPQHVDWGHPDYRAHRATADQIGCRQCRELSQRKPEPKPPVRRGRFLIHERRK